MSDKIKNYLDKLEDRPDLQAKFALYCAKRCEGKLKDDRSKNALRACETGTVTKIIVNNAYAAADVAAHKAAYADSTYASLAAAHAALAAAHAAAHNAAYAARAAYYAAYSAIKAADNREAQEEAIIQKLKQIVNAGGWVE